MSFLSFFCIISYSYIYFDSWENNGFLGYLSLLKRSAQFLGPAQDRSANWSLLFNLRASIFSLMKVTCMARSSAPKEARTKASFLPDMSQFNVLVRRIGLLGLVRRSEFLCEPKDKNLGG